MSSPRNLPKKSRLPVKLTDQKSNLRFRIPGTYEWDSHSLSEIPHQSSWFELTWKQNVFNTDQSVVANRSHTRSRQNRVLYLIVVFLSLTLNKKVYLVGCGWVVIQFVLDEDALWGSCEHVCVLVALFSLFSKIEGSRPWFPAQHIHLMKWRSFNDKHEQESGSVYYLITEDVLQHTKNWAGRVLRFTDPLKNI